MPTHIPIMMRISRIRMMITCAAVKSRGMAEPSGPQFSSSQPPLQFLTLLHSEAGLKYQTTSLSSLTLSPLYTCHLSPTKRTAQFVKITKKTQRKYLYSYKYYPADM